ncbi:MAG: hypothetical protein COA79_21720 [Planctomycetota bacterium]|nr:MAG: hypothetical protein COA79_21720 [Planctomycetota bacterium]
MKTVLSILLLCLVLLFSFCAYQITNSEKGENVESVSWLPSTASEISYYKRFSTKAYEFTISETGFLKWAKEKNYKIEPINKVKSNHRYKLLLEKPYPDEYNYEKLEELRKGKAEVYMYYRMVYATKGYYVQDLDPGTSGGYVLLYSTTNNRAYYFWSAN